MDQKRTLHPAVAALIVIVLIGIVASVVIAVNANKDNSTNTSGTEATSVSSSDNTSDSSQDTSTDTATYKDGTYDATGTYLSPGGRESIDLSVTIKDGVITETTLVTNASDAEAEEYQALFSKNYKQLVVGKSVKDLRLSRVAGSSLTSNGFNDALDTIRDDAKA